jgi:hypothetical protein
MRMLRIIELPVEQVERLLDLTNLLDKSVVRWISTKFDVGPMSSSFETSLRNLQRSLLVADGLLQLLDVFLLWIGN